LRPVWRTADVTEAEFRAGNHPADASGAEWPTFWVMQASPGPGAPPQFSGDHLWWWDGYRWTSIVSPDGRYRWTGTAWVPMRKMLFGDFANQSIAAVVIGIFCGLFFPFGIYAGYRAYQELPWKRTQATVGIVLNSIGFVLWLLSALYKLSVAGR
jgi:hypothetical protein